MLQSLSVVVCTDFRLARIGRSCGKPQRVIG
jgi:hypothetical protein